MEYHNNKFLGFTLPEVLITIVIIGVVAAMTLSPLITKIRNKGYAERLIKTYSVLQNATNQIVEENGLPKDWGLSIYYDSSTFGGNDKVINFYKKYLKIVKECKQNYSNVVETECYIKPGSYRYLNGLVGATGPSNNVLFSGSGGKINYTFVLNDGVVISFRFLQGTYGGVAWGSPDMLITVDVNGKAGPNQIGRDTFFFYLKKNGDGKILPYANETFPNGGIDYRNTCEPDLKGFSCAYRIITEGGMNY